MVFGSVSGVSKSVRRLSSGDIKVMAMSVGVCCFLEMFWGIRRGILVYLGDI